METALHACAARQRASEPLSCPSTSVVQHGSVGGEQECTNIKVRGESDLRECDNVTHPAMDHPSKRCPHFWDLSPCYCSQCSADELEQIGSNPYVQVTTSSTNRPPASLNLSVSSQVRQPILGLESSLSASTLSQTGSMQQPLAETSRWPSQQPAYTHQARPVDDHSVRGCCLTVRE